MKPIQGGDFFCHEPPPLSFRLLSLLLLKISVCHGDLNANVCEISASKRVTLQPLFEELFKKAFEGRNKKDTFVSLIHWDIIQRYEFDREKE